MKDGNKPIMIDSHAHLDYAQLSDDIDGVLARAASAGVSDIITIGVKLTTSNVPKTLAETYDNIWCSIGIHPHEAASEPDAANIGAILAAADHPKCVAIGEAGLDYFYSYATPKQQEDSFRAQIAVARQLGLPIIVHARDADDDVAAILEDEMEKGAFRGVLHCFSSGAVLAQRAIAIGFYISFSGILTFNKAEELRAIAADIPEDRLMVETDSPYLAPVPHRGRPNEPAYTVHTLTKLASVRGKQIDCMADITRQNTLRLFNRMVAS
ncbi:TatD family hydrolase [Candidatus Puniceispirillum sp.]|nr:TatD family hydrolase [Candidatus Puniceispirillum sp.]